MFVASRSRETPTLPNGSQGHHRPMPAKSKKQQMAAGAALAAKHGNIGERSKSSLKGASRSMFKSMSARQLRGFAKTKRRNLPTRRRR